VPSLQAWAESLGGITYPLLSDFYPHGKVAQQFGVLRADGRSERAIYVIDRSCTVRYARIHDLDEQPDNDELFRVLAAMEKVSFERLMGEARTLEASSQAAEVWDPNLDVIMYCTAWCPACRRARAFLQQYNVRYKEIDIARDRQAGQLVRSWAKGYETTPTFNVRGNILVEFNRAKLAEMLGIKEW
jgi:glutaredoxin